jgi:betaine-aldehyde dehydrogenase
MGVVGCIVPWNYPLLLLAWKIAPALAAGTRRLQALRADAALDARAGGLLRGLPPGSSTSSPGAARSARRSSATSASTASRSPVRSAPGSGLPRSAPSGSRGSTSSSAARIRSSSARTWRPGRGRGERAALGGVPERGPGLHLGGAASTSSSGVRRLRVRVRRLHRVAATGRPARPATDVGPLVSARQRDKVAAQVDGASRPAPSSSPGGQRGGQRHRPLLRAGGRHRRSRETDLLREETFGPVAPLVPVKSLDEAIELANSTRFGLGCNVYTKDLDSILRCMREIKAGTSGSTTR